MKWLKLNNPRQSKRQKWLQEKHMRTFTHWLRKKGIEFILKIAPFLALITKNSNNYGPFKQVEVAIANKEPISETLRWIAHCPTHYVSKYHGYVINGCHYNTKDCDEV